MNVLSNTCDATEFDYSYGAKVEYSDNVALTTTDKQADTIASALAGMSLAEETSTIDADIRVMFKHDTYLNDTYTDQNWGYLSGDLIWTIRPRTFFWTIEEYFSQQEIDSLEPDTPDNLINSNAFITGPDLVFHINPASDINIGVRYSAFRYDQLNTNNERISFDSSWLTRLTYSSEFSINLGHQTVKYGELEDADFNRQNFFSRFTSQLARSTFEVDAGISYISRDSNEDFDGFVGRLFWRNQFREQSYYQLDISTQYTDSSQDLLNYRPLDLSSTQITGDLFYDKRIEGTYHISTYQSTYDLLVFYRDEDYEELLQDRIISGLRFSYSYIPSPALTLNSQLEEARSYDNIDLGRKDDRITAILSAAYLLSPDYTLQLQYSYLDQQSNLETSNFTENKIMLTFYYGRNPGSYR